MRSHEGIRLLRVGEFLERLKEADRSSAAGSRIDVISDISPAGCVLVPLLRSRSSCRTTQEILASPTGSFVARCDASLTVHSTSCISSRCHTDTGRCVRPSGGRDMAPQGPGHRNRRLPVRPAPRLVQIVPTTTSPRRHRRSGDSGPSSARGGLPEATPQRRRAPSVRLSPGR